MGGDEARSNRELRIVDAFGGPLSDAGSIPAASIPLFSQQAFPDACTPNPYLLIGLAIFYTLRHTFCAETFYDCLTCRRQ